MVRLGKVCVIVAGALVTLAVTDLQASAQGGTEPELAICRATLQGAGAPVRRGTAEEAARA